MSVTVERLSAVIDADPAAAIAALRSLDLAADAAAENRDATITIHTEHSQLDALTDALRGAGYGGDSGAGGLDNFSGAASRAGGNSMRLRTILMGGLGLPAIVGLATGATGALQMLAAAAAGAGSALGSLSGILGAVPVGLAAIVGGAGATVMGFQGVGEAIKAADVVLGASPMSTGQAASSLRAVENATRQVENAYRSLTRAQEQVAEAEEDLARTWAESERNIAEAYEDAQDRIADAEERTAERIRRAREYAADSGERLEDAQFRYTGALLSERQAVIDLEKAQKRLADVQNGVGKSSMDMAKATDDFTGKVYEISRVSGDAADEQDSQRQAVLDLERAQLNLARAIDAVGDSERDLAKERKAHADAPMELAREEARAVKDLQDTREDAAESIARAEQQAARNIEAAQKRVETAHRGVEDALRGVEDAQRALADAQEASAVAAAGGQAALDKYNAAMANLTPVGREFVHFMTEEFLPAWRDLQRAAQAGLLPGVIVGLEELMTMFPMLEGQIFDFAQTMGDHFAEFFLHIARPDNIEQLEGVLSGLNDVLGGVVFPDGTELKGILDIFVPLYEIILKIIEAATPMTQLLTDDIVRGLESVARYLNTEEGFAALEGWFERGYYFGGLFMDVLGPLATVIGDVSEAARPLAEWMLKTLADYFGELAETTSSLEGQTGMKKWFDDLRPAIEQTSGLIIDLFEVIFGQDTDPEKSGYMKLVTSIRENVIPALDDLLRALNETDIGIAIGEFFGTVVEFLTYIVENDWILEIVLGFFNGLGDALAWLDENTDGKGISLIMGFLAALGLVNFTLIAVGMASLGPAAMVMGTGISAGALLAAAPWIALVAAIGLVAWAIYDNWEKIKGWGNSFHEWATELERKLILWGVGVWDSFLESSEQAFNDINEWWDQLWTDIADAIDKFFLGASTLNSRFQTWSEGVWDGLWNGFKDALNAIIRAWNDLKLTVPEVKLPGGQTIGGWTFGTMDLPLYRQFGGPVEEGQPYIVGEKRAEMFIPSTSGRIASAVPRTEYGSDGGGLTEADIDRLIEKIMDLAKPDVKMENHFEEGADSRVIAHELAWSLR